VAHSPLRELVDEHRDEIVALARTHGAYEVRLIGSVASGEETSGSDIDFLVRFEPGRSLFDQAGLIHDLRRLLGVEVDVVSEGGLRDGDPMLTGATQL
jgi:uncharacterized protein